MSSEMENIQRKYRKIGFEERKSLIHMVIQEKRKVSYAARRLNINPSTARIIIQNYKQEGRIYEKKSQRLERRRQNGITTVDSESFNGEMGLINLGFPPSLSILPVTQKVEITMPVYIQYVPTFF